MKIQDLSFGGSFEGNVFEKISPCFKTEISVSVHARLKQCTVMKIRVLTQVFF